MEFYIRLGNISTETTLGDYYLDFSHTVGPVQNKFYGPIDERHVPLVDYDRLFLRTPIASKESYYGVHYTPVTIAQYGLGLYSLLLKKKSGDLSRLFLSQADWFIDNLTTTSLDFGVWLHHFDFPIYDLQPPWTSAMAQGQAISLLLRAYQLTGDKKYIETAESAFRSFLHDISDGGVSTVDREGHLWLEEFPTNPPTHVLNGFIFAVWGVLDYYRVTGSSVAKEVYDKCIQTLKHNIPRFEWDYWSRYDLVRSGNTSKDYHRIHTLQLRVLGMLEQDDLLNGYARRWEDYSKGNCRIRRLIKSKPFSLLRRLGLVRPKTVKGVRFAE